MKRGSKVEWKSTKARTQEIRVPQASLPIISPVNPPNWLGNGVQPISQALL